tara:strand:+ start:148 stop:453 length:306 start_codon:yes stop_codon:yes gene_type:complete
MNDKSSKALDFIEYKKTGKLSYVEIEDCSLPEDIPDASETLDNIAEVMGLSTDELFLEIGFMLERGVSPRGLSLDLLVSELSSRLVLMESICLYASNIDKS